MLKLKILTYLSRNPGAKPVDIAAAIGEDMTDISMFLYESRDVGLVQFNGIDYSWTITEEGARHASKEALNTPISTREMAIDPTPVPDPASSGSVQSEQRTDKSLEVDKNIARMFGFLEEWYMMDLTPLRDITTDSRVRWYKLNNHIIRGLPGIAVDEEIPDRSCWIAIDRLKPIPPPLLDEILNKWMKVEDKPGMSPIISETIEVIDAEATEDLWQEYREQEARRATLSAKEQEEAEPLVKPKNVMREIALSDCPEVMEAHEGYMARWDLWSAEEAPRRKTIEIYQELFSYRQQLESGTSSNPQELVWGVGMTYRTGGNRLRFPLFSIPVEFLPGEDLTLRIASIDRPAGCNIHALLAEFPEGGAAFEANIRKELSLGPDQPGLSPFDTERLQRILKVDAGVIDSSTVFAESQPEAADVVTFTLDWVVMVQTRSSNYMLQDVQKLKEAAEEQGVPPCALEDIAIRRRDPYPDSEINYRGFSHVGTEHSGEIPTRELYFPKPYNQEQVEVIRKLEGSEGVVLQGPPGTGKTHTIANVISHYLATGKRVLVTSQKTPALKALKSQLPEGIQMLTGMLLESDREGQAELECSVNRITSEILHYNERTLEEEIRNLEVTVNRTHEALQRNEKRTDILACQYRTRPPVHIGCESPRELAQEVAEAASLHEGFPDELDSELGWKEGEIDDMFFDRLRSRRQAVGEHLNLDRGTIFDSNLIPTVETCVNLHLALRSYASIRRELDQLTEHKPTGYLSPGQREMADQTAHDLEKLRDGLAAANAGGWQKLVFCCYFAPWKLPEEFQGTEDLIRNAIEPCIALHRANDQEAKSYLLKPVELPVDGPPLETLLERVALASAGQKPILLKDWISARSLIRAIESITIRGERPKTQEEWSDIKRWIELTLAGNQLAKDWNFLAGRIDLPLAPENVGVDVYAALRSASKQIETIWAFNMEMLERRIIDADTLLELGNKPEILAGFCQWEPHRLDPVVKTLQLLVKELDGRVSAMEFEKLLKLLAGRPVYAAFYAMVQARLGSAEFEVADLEVEWRAFLREAGVLWEKAPILAAIADDVALLEAAGAVNLARSVGSVPVDPESGGDTVLPPGVWNSWVWARRKAYLRSIDAKSELLTLNTERLHQERKLAKAYEDLAVKQTWRKLKQTFKATPSLVTALNQFVTHIKKIGRGTGGLAPFHRAQAQAAMKEADEAIRCWIMPQWRISESLPAKFGMFDLVIIDEASQSDLKALPAIARGKKVLIVGDDKQVSPLQVGTTNNKVMELYERFLKDLPFGSVMTLKESVYDLASIAYGAATIRLREHFRCSEPIINFSSKHFYDGEIRCLRVPKATERMLPTLVDVFLEAGVRSDARKTNKVEADYIVDEIGKLTKDPEFRDRSIGVITLLGNEQSKLIWDTIQSKLSEEVILKHGIRCGDSSTFQGSEFDVVFLSMVDHMPKRILTTVEYEQRYNVAASRARDRMYLCRSVPFEILKSTDLRHKLVAHFSDPGLKVKGTGREDCESPFEEEVFDFIAENGYMVSTQVVAAGFRIDMVVEDVGGRRLAVECDGYIAHPEHRWAEDMSRQRTLERAGWSFHRIWGPSYYSDPAASLEELLEAIVRHGIEKHGGIEATASGIIEFRHVTLELEPVDLFEEDDEGEKEVDESVTWEADDDAGEDEAAISYPNEQNLTIYQTMDYSGFSNRIDPENFYSESYDATLVELLRQTLLLEAPIAADLLVQRIARAHDFKRSGRLIRERVLALVDDHFHLGEDLIGGDFVWLSEEVPDLTIPIRTPKSGETARNIEEIPCEEILEAAIHAGAECSAVQIARIFGIRRLASPGKERIDRAIEILKERRCAVISAAGTGKVDVRQPPKN
jgi:very-short-patch-repair endonuclease